MTGAPTADGVTGTVTGARDRDRFDEGAQHAHDIAGQVETFAAAGKRIAESTGP